MGDFTEWANWNLHVFIPRNSYPAPAHDNAPSLARDESPHTSTNASIADAHIHVDANSIHNHLSTFTGPSFTQPHHDVAHSSRSTAVVNFTTSPGVDGQKESHAIDLTVDSPPFFEQLDFIQANRQITTQKLLPAARTTSNPHLPISVASTAAHLASLCPPMPPAQPASPITIHKTMDDSSSEEETDDVSTTAGENHIKEITPIDLTFDSPSISEKTAILKRRSRPTYRAYITQRSSELATTATNLLPSNHCPVSVPHTPSTQILDAGQQHNSKRRHNPTSRLSSSIQDQQSRFMATPILVFPFVGDWAKMELAAEGCGPACLNPLIIPETCTLSPDAELTFTRLSHSMIRRSRILKSMVYQDTIDRLQHPKSFWTDGYVDFWMSW